MKPVMQTEIHLGHGDCQRAVIASLLELDPQMVPHFAMFRARYWWHVLHYFLYALGWELEGCMNPPIDERFHANLAECGIDGYHYAGVYSRTYPDVKPRVTHAVIIDSQGVVVHDPNPNQLWAGENVFEQSDIVASDLCIYLMKPREGMEEQLAEKRLPPLGRYEKGVSDE